MRTGVGRLVLSGPTTTTPKSQHAVRHVRFQSTAPRRGVPATASLSPRWLSDTKARIGKCIMFGLNEPQTEEAGALLAEMTANWRDLVAGSEGFLTDQAGLFRQETVWGEMDSMGHINNVMYNRYAESARVNWTLHFANVLDPAHGAEWRALVTPSDIGLILRSIKTEFKFPMKWPDKVTVLHKLRDRPHAASDHFILDALILSEVHRRPAARCVEDIVVYDYKIGRKSPLKGFMVDKFRETFALQEQAKQKWGDRVSELIRRVHDLEKDSWDRPDAQEDMGTANA